MQIFKFLQQKREYLKDLKNQMEVKTMAKVDIGNDLKADANVKDTARHEHNERLQNVRERKLQQLRYQTRMQNLLMYIQIICFRIWYIFRHILFLSFSEHIMYRIDTYEKLKRNVKTLLNQDSHSLILV